LGPSALTLYKHVLGRRRILIFTLPPVEAACILCQVASDICYEAQAESMTSASNSNYTSIESSLDHQVTGGGEVFGRDASRERKLKGRNKEGIKVLGMVNLNDMDKLEEEGKSGRGWIACESIVFHVLQIR
jgi:hypothetical protein